MRSRRLVGRTASALLRRLNRMYLLDTNVVSELRRPRPNRSVVEWIKGIAADQMFLSAVTIGEIQAGIEVIRSQDKKKASELTAWLANVIATHQVLPMDVPAFREWARLIHGKSNSLIQDAMIAATANVRGLTVVTRNRRDFVALGVSPFNPFEER